MNCPAFIECTGTSQSLYILVVEPLTYRWRGPPVFELDPNDPQKTVQHNVKSDLDRWNNHYKYVASVEHIDTSDRRLLDPSFLFVGMPLSVLINSRTRWLMNDLKCIASSHSIRYFNTNKMELLNAMTDHRCNEICKSRIYIFKELPFLKFSRPWDSGPIMRVVPYDSRDLVTQQPLPPGK
jgi:hypothetical protein